MALFLAALILMPVLVLDYQERTSDDGVRVEVDHRDSLLPPPVPPMPTSLPPGRIIAFDGVTEGETLVGFEHISLETTGEIGTVGYTLVGPDQTYEVRSDRDPYLFAPHSTGWNTVAVPDGRYTLQAASEHREIPALTISFVVGNRAGGASGASNAI